MTRRSEHVSQNPRGQRSVPVRCADIFSRIEGIKANLAAGALCGLLLTACATDRSVEARIAQTGESFTGTFEPGTFGGSLEMESDRTRCTGRSTGSETIGTTVVVLVCDDGRAGSAVLLDGPTRASGSGVLGDDQVSLSIAR
jgi:hypothetical protein